VFGLKGFQIDRMKFEVRFYFDTDERLKEVGLSPEGGETKIPVSRSFICSVCGAGRGQLGPSSC
jgi:hypothetical protein